MTSHPYLLADHRVNTAAVTGASPSTQTTASASSGCGSRVYHHCRSAASHNPATGSASRCRCSRSVTRARYSCPVGRTACTVMPLAYRVAQPDCAYQPLSGSPPSSASTSSSAITPPDRARPVAPADGQRLIQAHIARLTLTQQKLNDMLGLWPVTRPSRFAPPAMARWAIRSGWRSSRN